MNQPLVERYATRVVLVTCPCCEKSFILRFRVSDDATEDEKARLPVIRPCPYEGCKEEIAYEVDARFDKENREPKIMSAKAYVPPPDGEDSS